MTDVIALLQRPRRSTYVLTAAFIATFGVYLLVRPDPPPVSATNAGINQPQPVYIVTTTTTTTRPTTTTSTTTSTTVETQTTSSTTAPSTTSSTLLRRPATTSSTTTQPTEE